MNFRFLVITDYCLNTETYSKNCINKDRPQLNCNGKCQMNKKIAVMEKNEMDSNDHNTGNKIVNLYNSEEHSAIIFSFTYKLTAEYPSQETHFISSNYLSEILRPPCA